MKNVARRIKETRQNKGISQAELADRLHYTLEKLIEFEEGKAKLSLEDIAEFATALEVTEDYLRRGDYNNTLNKITDSAFDNSPVTTTHSTTTNNYYGDEADFGDRASLKAQLDRIEQKLDFLIQNR
ncbi:hypothetical protein RO21_09075 [[Actinobacillus] muris]|uniref:HTH cro/C1-type domain-containing protein n=1 Tax=Muribacter muris TaxID=67855 RepID=A0A0J5S277_9PAST|nr:helix-turn-helix transcriptional regulator [Muribacter muris]KMK50927.1 hypothetical protein RO21_09075 [[Actinobacillus] muris] [Muribacter muris]